MSLSVTRSGKVYKAEESSELSLHGDTSFQKTSICESHCMELKWYNAEKGDEFLKISFQPFFDCDLNNVFKSPISKSLREMHFGYDFNKPIPQEIFHQEFNVSFFFSTGIEGSSLFRAKSKMGS